MAATPLFFGRADRQLYGVYNEPGDGAGHNGAGRDTAIVLAYPAFPEYNKAHWAFRRLAERTAQEGFFTLRFDYFATGDSAGPSEAGSIDQWIDDIGTAANEALDLSGARDVSIVGLRLGAALAASAVDAGLDVRDLVLWDPVVVGHDYMSHLLARARIQRRVRLLTPRRKEGQLLGYPFPDSLRHDMERIDLRGLGLTGPKHMELIATNDDRRVREWCDELERKGRPTRMTQVRTENVSGGGREVVRMSAEPIDAVVEALLRAEAP